MDFVRNRHSPAWVSFGASVLPVQRGFMERLSRPCRGVRRRTPMNINTDWFYIVMTIVAFGVLWLIVKGVEKFER